MAYQKFEVILEGDKIKNSWTGRPCTDEELDNIKNCFLDATGYSENIEKQIQVKLLERRDD